MNEIFDQDNMDYIIYEYLGLNIRDTVYKVIEKYKDVEGIEYILAEDIGILINNVNIEIIDNIDGIVIYKERNEGK